MAPYLSLEYLAIDMVVGAVLPPFDSSTVDVGRKGKGLVARRADLNSVTVAEWDSEVH